jgi:spore protease
MEKYLNSDLACEKFHSDARESGDGEYEEKEIGSFKLIRLTRREGEALQNYVTFECGRIWELEGHELDELGGLIADSVRAMAERITGRKIDRDFSVLVVGLGNDEITADAIGPQCVRGITATKHLREYDESMFLALECCEVSAISPGVLGQTGIESVDVIRGILRESKVDLVIVIDALAARDCERLASTVQLSDAGIDPGAGIGNHRKKIDREMLGVPMLAIGVPTVVNSSALICGALRRAGIEEIDERLEEVLERGRSFYVSPKESDVITKKVAELLSLSIKKVFSEAFV